MEDQDQDQGHGQAIIAKLLKRMDSNPGFAGLGGAVQTISRLNDDADSDNRLIASTILQDAALTGRLLRLSNASSRGTRNVSTIDQAISVLGLNTVKSVAISLALLDSVSNKPQSNLLHAEIVAAYFCGTLAAKITRGNAPRYNTQEAQVCGLMQNLGRMMAIYYLYEDLQSSHALQAEKNLSEDEAVAETLGKTFDEIGLAIAHHWNLPDVIQQSMTPSVSKMPPRPSPNALGWHQVCALFARHITDAVFRHPENREKAEIHQNVNFFHHALLLKNDETHEWVDQALEDTNTLLSELAFPCNVEQAQALLRKASERVLDTLSSQDSLTKSSPKGDEKKPIEIIHQALRSIHDEFGFDLTLLCLPNGPAALVAVSGVGRNANQVTPKFRCSGAKADIFRLVMTKKVDMYVADVHAPSYAKLLPDWYLDAVGGNSFLALSLVHEGKFLGLLYGDYSAVHPEAPKEKNEGAVQKWRNLIIAALQAGTPHH